MVCIDYCNRIGVDEASSILSVDIPKYFSRGIVGINKCKRRAVVVQEVIIFVFCEIVFSSTQVNCGVLVIGVLHIDVRRQRTCISNHLCHVGITVIVIVFGKRRD